MVEPEVLFDKLASMSVSEIADFCTTSGVRGFRECEFTCVLAELFHKETGLEAVTVGSVIRWAGSWDEVEEDWPTDTWPHVRESTEEIKLFIERFDHGKFPHLVTPYEDYE